MRKRIEAVMLRLKEQVPELSTVAVNVGQMSAENRTLPLPCALVDVAEVEYPTAGKAGSRGRLHVAVELFFRLPPAGSLPAEAEAGEAEAFGMFDLVARADAALLSLEAEGFHPLQPHSLTRGKDGAPRSFVLTYTCRAEAE